jgi:hypothetical protein
MSFSIATHTETRWTIGCYALAALSLALLSMVLPWVAFTILVLLGWSTWKEKQGRVGWFRGWIPKQHVTLQVNWTNKESVESKPTLIHFHMHTHHHWWIRSAGALLLLTAVCWICVFMGSVTISFAILPMLCIIGIIGHKSDANTEIKSSSTDGIEVFAPAETTWNGLQLFFEHHQTVLSTTGTLVVHSTPSSIPIQLPTGFEEWTIDYQSA